MNPLDLADGKKMVIIEKHPLVFFIVICIASLMTLFYLFLDLNKDFRQHLQTTNKVMIETLRDNTNVLKQTNDLLIKYTK